MQGSNTYESQSIARLLDANLNRLQEGIRVVEDIFRYVYNHQEIVYALKQMRHKAILNHQELLLQARDIEHDIAKESIESETKRVGLSSIIHANFHRITESARVLEECLKLESCHQYGESQTFKTIRYEAYHIHILASNISEKNK